MRKCDRLSLCVFIDALGWKLAQRHPFLDDVLVHKQPLQTVFGYSSTCDPTILTGKLPREHGHFSFFYYAPDRSPFGVMPALSLLPKSLSRRGRIRHWMSRAVSRYYGYSGYFQLYNMPFDLLPLYDYSEKRDIYQPGGIIGGQPIIFEHLREHGVPFYLSDWRLGERQNIQSLQNDIDSGRICFGYLYLAAMDAILHRHGPDAAEIAAKLDWYQEQLRRLLAHAARRYREVRLHVFSDHGMTPVTEVCDLKARIDALGLKHGHDYAVVYDSTMARFWFLRSGVRERIVMSLEDEPYGHIVTQQELHRWGCDFEDERYGELFFLLNPGVLLCPSFMGETRLAGMHGYDPDHEDSLAMFASNVSLTSPPSGLVDLFGFMLREAIPELVSQPTAEDAPEPRGMRPQRPAARDFPGPSSQLRSTRTVM